LVDCKEFLEIPESLEDEFFYSALAMAKMPAVFVGGVYLSGDDFKSESKPLFFFLFPGIFHVLILA